MEDTKNVTPEEAQASESKSSAPEKASSGKQKNKKNKNKGGHDETKSSSSSQQATESSNQSQYFGSDTMLSISANWSFANRLGDKIPTYKSANYINIMQSISDRLIDVNDNFGRQSVPGICTIAVMPTPGLNEHPGSALNVASYQQYGFLRSQISGSRPYSRHDMVMEWLAVDSCYMLSMACDRAIAAVNTLDQQNKYLAKDLVEAMGYDYDDLVANLANYISNFNVLKARLNRLTIPAVFPIVKRHSYMMSNVYLDTENPKSQMYVFRLAAIYQYDPARNRLKLVSLVPSTTNLSATQTMGAYLSRLRQMLDGIFADSKYAQISGDIEKAYGIENCLSIGITLPNTALQIVYDPEMLYEIHHVRFAGNIFSNETLSTNSRDSWNITVNMDTPSVYVEWNPILTDNKNTQGGTRYDYVRRAANLGLDIFLDSASVVPTPHENTVNTRLTFIGMLETDDPGVDQGKMRFACVGTELALWAVYTTYENNLRINTVKTDNLLVTESGSTSLNEDDMKALTLALPFKKGPIYWYCGFTEEGAEITKFSPSRLPLCEIRNYTVIGHGELYRLNNVVVQSMYSIPDAASYKLS